VIVERNNIVAIAYSLFDDCHNILDSNEGYAPLCYLHGAQNILPALEVSLEGMKVGEVKEIMLDAESGYGSFSPVRVYQIPRQNYRHREIQIGEILHLKNGEEVNVISCDDDYITVDGNHPLAGKALQYRVKIVAIRKATNSEMENGFPLTAKQTGCCPPGCC